MSLVKKDEEQVRLMVSQQLRNPIIIFANNSNASQEKAPSAGVG